MMSGGKSSGHRAIPSPATGERDFLEPLEAEYPMPNSLFPLYSPSHPGFDNPDADPVDENEEETIDFVNSNITSDGAARTMLTPRSVVKSPDEDKQFPLHVQTDETMDEDEDSIQHPSQFPCLSPPKKNWIPMYETPNAEKPDGIEQKIRALATRRNAIVGSALVALLIIIIAAAKASGSSSDSSSSSSTSLAEGVTNPPFDVSISPDVFALDLPDDNPFLPPKVPTSGKTPRPTDEPSSSPVATPETTAPTIISTTAPSPAPSTRAPTLPVNHPLIGVLQAVVPREILLDPYTPQGEALIWMATKDQRTESTDPRVIQRYAMTVLDVAMHAPEPRVWSSRNLHECRWPGVTCNNASHVIGVNWARQSLVGSIPPELGLLTHLEKVDVAQNQLNGNLDPLYSLEKLKHAYVFENLLTGTLSNEIENCGNLTRFFAGHNRLSGSIPSNLKMRPLEWFILHFNRLTGTIPSDLSLGLNTVFDISHNKLEGTIPENFATEILPNVRHVHLDHNQFTGSIPQSFTELGKGRLRQLFLNDNKLEGKFPENWLYPKFLNNIDLSNNRFRSNLNEMCVMSVFEYGELVELRADCAICNCDRLCRICRDNKEHKYVYDDDWDISDYLDDDGV